MPRMFSKSKRPLLWTLPSSSIQGRFSSRWSAGRIESIHWFCARTAPVPRARMAAQEVILKIWENFIFPPETIVVPASGLQPSGGAIEFNRLGDTLVDADLRGEAQFLPDLPVGTDPTR